MSRRHLQTGPAADVLPVVPSTTVVLGSLVRRIGKPYLSQFAFVKLSFRSPRDLAGVQTGRNGKNARQIGAGATSVDLHFRIRFVNEIKQTAEAVHFVLASVPNLLGQQEKRGLKVRFHL